MLPAAINCEYEKFGSSFLEVRSCLALGWPLGRQKWRARPLDGPSAGSQATIPQATIQLRLHLVFPLPKKRPPEGGRLRGARNPREGGRMALGEA
jgi:hypothetical protein